MTSTAEQARAVSPLGARQLAPRIYADRARRLALRIQLRAHEKTFNELAPRRVAAIRVNGQQA